MHSDRNVPEIKKIQFADDQDDELACPVSFERMNDAVIFPSGRSYARTSIQKSAAGKFTDPFDPSSVVGDAELYSNNLLNKVVAAIGDDREKHFELTPENLALLTCPLTGKIFEDPIIAADGITYEKQAYHDKFGKDKVTYRNRAIEFFARHPFVQELKVERELKVGAAVPPPQQPARGAAHAAAAIPEQKQQLDQRQREREEFRNLLIQYNGLKKRMQEDPHYARRLVERHFDTLVVEHNQRRFRLHHFLNEVCEQDADIADFVIKNQERIKSAVGLLLGDKVIEGARIKLQDNKAKVSASGAAMDARPEESREKRLRRDIMAGLLQDYDPDKKNEAGMISNMKQILQYQPAGKDAEKLKSALFDFCLLALISEDKLNLQLKKNVMGQLAKHYNKYKPGQSQGGRVFASNVPDEDAIKVVLAHEAGFKGIKDHPACKAILSQAVKELFAEQPQNTAATQMIQHIDSIKKLIGEPKKYRVWMAGDPTVGRDTLAYRAAGVQKTDAYVKSYEGRVAVTVDDGTELEVYWDNGYRNMGKTVVDMGNFDAALIVVDVDDQQSKENVDSWFNQITHQMEGTVKVLVGHSQKEETRGNYSPEVVTFFEQKKDYLGADVMLIDSFNSNELKQLFEQLVSKLHYMSNDPSVDPRNNPQPPKKGPGKDKCSVM